MGCYRAYRGRRLVTPPFLACRQTSQKFPSPLIFPIEVAGRYRGIASRRGPRSCSKLGEYGHLSPPVSVVAVRRDLALRIQWGEYGHLLSPCLHGHYTPRRRGACWSGGYSSLFSRCPLLRYPLPILSPVLRIAFCHPSTAVRSPSSLVFVQDSTSLSSRGNHTSSCLL